jgi:hypothetical protein
MKRLFKGIGIVIGLGILGLGFGYCKLNKPMPVSVVPVATENQAPEAEVLTDKMFTALNKQAWDQTGWIKWTFKDKHHFIWDRSREMVLVKWDDKEVTLNLKDQSGKVMENGKEVTGDAATAHRKSAWSMFCNDSFWLIAPYKARDKGTERSVVALENGGRGLMVKYTDGGVTPGDSYLWTLDEAGTPLNYQMWVKIIPIGGLKSTWEQWTTLPTGAKIATSHKLPTIDLTITGLDAGFGVANF